MRERVAYKRVRERLKDDKTMIGNKPEKYLTRFQLTADIEEELKQMTPAQARKRKAECLLKKRIQMPILDRTASSKIVTQFWKK